MKRFLAALFAATAVVSLAACTSDADRADENLKKAAEQFEIQRTIVGINGISGEILFYAEGRCSFEESGRRVDATCKYGPDDIRKQTFLRGDQDSVVITQEEAADPDVYRTRIIIKPQNLLPQFDLEMGEE